MRHAIIIFGLFLSSGAFAAEVEVAIPEEVGALLSSGAYSAVIDNMVKPKLKARQFVRPSEMGTQIFYGETYAYVELELYDNTHEESGTIRSTFGRVCAKVVREVVRGYFMVLSATFGSKCAPVATEDYNWPTPIIK